MPLHFFPSPDMNSISKYRRNIHSRLRFILILINLLGLIATVVCHLSNHFCKKLSQTIFLKKHNLKAVVATLNWYYSSEDAFIYSTCSLGTQTGLMRVTKTSGVYDRIQQLKCLHGNICCSSIGPMRLLTGIFFKSILKFLHKKT